MTNFFIEPQVNRSEELKLFEFVITKILAYYKVVSLNFSFNNSPDINIRTIECKLERGI